MRKLWRKKGFNGSSKCGLRASNNIKTLGRGGPFEIVYYTVMETETKVRKWLSQTLGSEWQCLDSWPRASPPTRCFFRLPCSLPSKYQHTFLTSLHPPQPQVFEYIPMHRMYYKQTQEMDRLCPPKRYLWTWPYLEIRVFADELVLQVNKVFADEDGQECPQSSMTVYLFKGEIWWQRQAHTEKGDVKTQEEYQL